MKRIVVTGAKGGTGRSIVHVLQAKGYDVLGIDLHPRDRTDTAYATHDLLSSEGLHDLLAGADSVAHFGSYAGDVSISWSEAYRNLMVGGFNVFQACANLGIKRIVHASSLQVYGNRSRASYLPIDEQYPLLPRSIYGSAKVMLEQLAKDYCRWHGMSIAALRLGRIVYEGCFASRLKRYTESDEAAANDLWTYVDARDVATLCQAWFDSNIQGFTACNVVAPDVCVPTPTRQLLRHFYPHVKDVRAQFEERQSPIDTRKVRRMLNWNAKYSWQMLRDESERTHS